MNKHTDSMNPFDSDNECEPLIHVRSLGQFEYCPRAGLLAFESQGEQPESDDDPVPNLGFSPPMEIAKLEELIGDRRERLRKALFLAAVTFATATLISNISDVRFGLLMWVAFVLPFSVAVVAWRDLAVLRNEHRRFEKAPAHEFHTGFRRKCQVDWWQLVKVYQSALVRASYYDRGLGGRPWRVISSERYRFPVILSGADDFEIKSAHRVRLAAYARLIEASEGSTSDWGVVIFKSKRIGVAVPLNLEEIARANRLLTEFRAAIAQSERGISPAAGHPNACSRCPFNRRRLYRAGKTETRVGSKTLRPYMPLGDETHCDCGDRFRWTPPSGLART